MRCSASPCCMPSRAASRPRLHARRPLFHVGLFGWPDRADGARRLPVEPMRPRCARVSLPRGARPPAHPDHSSPLDNNGETNMEVILLERVAKLGQMGEVVRVKDGFRAQFPAAARQGAARHQGQQGRFEMKGAARGAQPRAQGGRGDRRKSSTARASWCSARPATPASCTARFRPATSPRRCGRRLHGQPQADRAQPRSRRSACTRCRSRCIRRSR